MKGYRGFFNVLLFVILSMVMACSSSRYVRFDQVKPERSVRLFTYQGKLYEGLVLEKTDQSLTLINASDGQKYTFSRKAIRQIQPSQKEHDFDGKPITDAELERYRSTRNTLGYAIGGMLIGGFAGLVVGYPLWATETVNVPPFFTGGVAAIISSLYYGNKGMKKDEWEAVQKVRYIRLQNKRLKEQLQAEAERLKKLEQEKQNLLHQLNAKKNAHPDSTQQELNQ